MPRSLPALFQRFLIAFLCFVITTLWAPIDVRFFVPPLVMLITVGSYRQATIASLLIGFFLDIAIHSPRFGFMALTMILATIVMHSFRRMLTKDHFITLALLSYIYSMLLSIFEILLACIIDIPLPSVTMIWAINYIFLMPFLDAFYALLIFSLPDYLFSRYYASKKYRR